MSFAPLTDEARLPPGDGRFRRGQWVVHRTEHYGPTPRPDARRVEPARRGDGYRSVVERVLVVEQVLPDGRMVLRDASGDVGAYDSADPHLRPASWWTRLSRLALVLGLSTRRSRTLAHRTPTHG